MFFSGNYIVMGYISNIFRPVHLSGWIWARVDKCTGQNCKQLYTALYTAANIYYSRNTSESMCFRCNTYFLMYICLPAETPHSHPFPAILSSKVGGLARDYNFSKFTFPWTGDTVLLCPLWWHLPTLASPPSAPWELAHNNQDTLLPQTRCCSTGLTVYLHWTHH